MPLIKNLLGFHFTSEHGFSRPQPHFCIVCVCTHMSTDALFLSDLTLLRQGLTGTLPHTTAFLCPLTQRWGYSPCDYAQLSCECCQSKLRFPCSPSKHSCHPAISPAHLSFLLLLDSPLSPPIHQCVHASTHTHMYVYILHVTGDNFFSLSVA